MTTTDLYSGYDRDGKPTSRVLQPPGGGSSNIFGSEPAPQQQLKKQEQKEMLDSNQNQAAPPPVSQSQEAQSRTKPRKGVADAPYAENDMENPHERHGSSQNDKDFRCHSVTAYREAVVRNAEVRDRAHGGQATSVNPITHQGHSGEGPFNQYSESSQFATPPPQAYGRREQNREESSLPRHALNAYKEAVARNAEIRHKYPGGQAAASFNPITHEEYNGDGPPPQHIEHLEHAAPSIKQANLLDRQNYGRRDQHKASSFNPITGEEYPESYQQKQSGAGKNEEDDDKEQESKDVNENSTPTPAVTPTANVTPTGTNLRTSSRVLQPPGGATTKLW